MTILTTLSSAGGASCSECPTRDELNRYTAGAFVFLEGTVNGTAVARCQRRRVGTFEVRDIGHSLGFLGKSRLTDARDRQAVTQAEGCTARS